ncbi:hypothetical protein FB451DRAFT_1449048 [Mycena latifolia]|nr:hypothetical protein FB451DRAFT_1449048 [Mycena latifolia]
MSSKFARRAARARIPEIDTQIGALQLVLQTLIAERSSCQALQDAYKYPVLSLPHEITSEIFITFLPARPPPVGMLSPSFLCQICRTWQGIALSTPSLWRTICLNLDDGDRHPQHLRVLQAWLECSKNVPLSVALERQTDMAIVLPLEELRLIHGDMPRLRHLTYGPHELKVDMLVGASVVAFDRAPNLTNVVLSLCFDPFAVVLPWSQLTTLEGCLFDIEIVEVLRHSRNLERCSLSLPLSNRLTEPITVPPLLHLTTLSISIYEGGFCKPAFLFGALTLPALQLLQLDERVLRGDLERGMLALVSFSEGFYRTLFQDSVPKIEVHDYLELLR